MSICNVGWEISSSTTQIKSTAWSPTKVFLFKVSKPGPTSTSGITFSTSGSVSVWCVCLSQFTLAKENVFEFERERELKGKKEKKRVLLLMLFQSNKTKEEVHEQKSIPEPYKFLFFLAVNRWGCSRKHNE